MSSSSRDRLARLMRQPDPDLAAAALCVCVEFQPEVDVDAELLRLDGIADSLRSQGFLSTTPVSDAEALAAWLGDELGFRGPDLHYHTPRHALLTDVLDARRGLPITLSIVYIAVARRLRVPAFGIGLPGHFVTGIGGGDLPVVIDPFDEGRMLDEDDLDDLVRDATGGAASYHRSMLRPSEPVQTIRRLLANLTRDFANEGDLQNAITSLELRALLPGTPIAELRERGELLARVGRYDEAADVLDEFVTLADDSVARSEARRIARRARAKLN